MKPSVTDWLQAWGTLAGALFAAVAAIAAFLLLLHEIRIRRSDEADGRASTARSILVSYGQPKGEWPTDKTNGSITHIELHMHNFSRYPILDVAMSADRLDGGPRFGTWSTGILRPGMSSTAKWTLNPPVSWPTNMGPPGLFRTKITFTDDNGLRWQRIDGQQPIRILSVFADPQADHDRPIRKLGDSGTVDRSPSQSAEPSRQKVIPADPSVQIMLNAAEAGMCPDRVLLERGRSATPLSQGGY